MAKSKRQKELERERRSKEKTDHWLIVHRPWFRDYYKRRASLTYFDLGDALWWLSILLRCDADKISSLQHQTNKTYIVVKVDLDVDVQSRLGEYKWENFLVRPSDTEKELASQVFEYNYLDFGDPSENQWKEDFPELPKRPPFQSFVRRFPDPAWCERPRIEPIDWSVPLPNPPNASRQSVSSAQLPTPSTDNMEASVSLLSRPPVYSSVNNSMTRGEVNAASSTFRPYQSTLHQMLPSLAVLPLAKNEQLEEQRQFIKIHNPYGVRWLDADQPDFSVGILNWLQLIVDGPEELYAEVERKRVVVRIGGHVSLNGVLGRHLWRNFLRDCPRDASDEESVIVRTDEDEIKDSGFLKIDIPAVDEDYGAFVLNYPYPEAYMDENDEFKPDHVKLESKEQVKKESVSFTGSVKRELYDPHDGEDRKKVKLE